MHDENLQEIRAVVSVFATASYNVTPILSVEKI